MGRPHIPSLLACTADWRTSTFSGGANGNCVEVGSVPDFVGVRDTKLGSASPILVFTDPAWTAFLSAVRRGDFTS